MSNKMVGRVNNEPKSQKRQGTSRPQEVISRVNNESETNIDSKTTSQKKEIGRVNSERKPALDDQKTPKSPDRELHSTRIEEGRRLWKKYWDDSGFRSELAHQSPPPN
jgi:hypothetical protein